MDSKIKFLEMIQNLITRMSTNSFMLKGWAVTLVAGTFALSNIESNNLLFLIAYVPIILFWFLDSYYLQLERKYREFYNEIVEMENDKVNFKIIVLQSKNESKTLFYQCFLSCTEIGFYLPMALLIAIVIILTLIKFV